MYGLKDRDIKMIRKVFSKSPRVDRAILYGSRAKGNFMEGSDIDLVLQGEMLTLTELMAIENELEDLNLPYHIDLSILHKIENPDLIGHIKRCGIVFYEK